MAGRSESKRAAELSARPFCLLFMFRVRLRCLKGELNKNSLTRTGDTVLAHLAKEEVCVVPSLSIATLRLAAAMSSGTAIY